MSTTVTEETESDSWGVVANMRESSGKWVAGAKVHVVFVPGDGESVKALVRSRSGRWIDIWVRTAILKNPRVKWVAQRFRNRVCAYKKREWAEGVADRLELILKARG